MPGFELATSGGAPVITESFPAMAVQECRQSATEIVVAVKPEGAATHAFRTLGQKAPRATKG